MSELSDSQRQLIQGLAAESGPVLLLRHSSRESLREASVEAAFDAQLTDEGRVLAARFGAELPSGPSARLFHSRVPRCQETAEILARELGRRGGEPVLVGVREELGAPWLRDPRRAIRRFAELGMAGFVRAWIAGEVSPEIAAPHAQAAGALLRMLLEERAAAPGTLQIHVAHDLTVVTLLGLAFPVGQPGFRWPGYLEGCLLRGDPAACLYRGERRVLTAPP